MDSGGIVRKGEELDIAAVDLWLRQQLAGLQGTPKVTQYAGGASNWTYRLEYANRDLILRRPPAGTKAHSAHDMVREYAVQRQLKPLFPAVPGMVALCQDAAVIGCDFYIMERIAGIIPRANLPGNLQLTPSQTRELCTNVLDQLIALHGVDPVAAGLESLGKGAGYCRRQVDGWDRRYAQVRTWNTPGFNSVRAWLKAHAPDDVATCVVHNDWRFDNIVLDPRQPTQAIGVLDWELATLGDPLMELGSMMAYWVQADDNFLMRATRRQPTHLPGMLTRREVLDYYLGKTGLACANWTFYEVFGLFRLAVIAQQIYYRYHHKQTRNPAFRHYWIFIHALHHRCRSLLAKADR